MNQGYAICLNERLFNKSIKSELNLLLYISSLTAEKGYCFATNVYLADKFGIGCTAISKKLSKLQKLNLINIKYKYKGKEIISREIFINLQVSKNDNTPCQKGQYPLSKMTIPLVKNAKDNNTSINITSINNKNNSKELQKDFQELIRQTISTEFINTLKTKYKINSEEIKKEFQSFVLYWTEKSVRGKKEKWEMQQTFDIKRRFYKWLENNNKWNSNLNLNKRSGIAVIE